MAKISDKLGAERRGEKRPVVQITRLLSSAYEWQEQASLVEWAAYYAKGSEPRLALLAHIPNGEERSPIIGGKLKRMGVQPGFPDLFLPIVMQGSGDKPAYAGCFVEMKRVAGGQLSPKQCWWRDQLTRQGYDYATCHGWVEAAKHLAWYLDRSDLVAGL